MSGILQDMEKYLDSVPAYYWHYTDEDPPQPGDRIFVELNGCKVGKYLIYKVREGEGLGHIKRWVSIDDLIDAMLDSADDSES